ncbi:hypothetical protein JMJ77_0011213 [Colletotrichum scovillei]|uniref:Uncharacterized protein n=1 Tax=Colletotrichum scovillei TaxID=1209932 RepID=A0A9P7UGJ9_9PEZI|nr:hypothetical protein JMJ77_0011213 [Colletotrichum scovillei]KAG7060215.1 hypothetical protein JMJ78_0015490 [Colletotrichum scovillei]KAG7067642.1 hypothetical protein JMJ76_0009070 [Colletotrichum scovillei]
MHGLRHKCHRRAQKDACSHTHASTYHRLACRPARVCILDLDGQKLHTTWKRLRSPMPSWSNPPSPHLSSNDASIFEGVVSYWIHTVG